MRQRLRAHPALPEKNTSWPGLAFRTQLSRISILSRRKTWRQMEVETLDSLTGSRCSCCDVEVSEMLVKIEAIAQQLNGTLARSSLDFDLRKSARQLERFRVISQAFLSERLGESAL